MDRLRRDTLVSALALAAVAVLVISPAGAAIRASFARDAAKVDGIAASGDPLPGRLVPLDASGKLPRSTVAQRPQRRGPHGEQGPAGLAGVSGAPGLDGPEWVNAYLSTKSWVVDSPEPRVVATAPALPPGTYLVLASALASRQLDPQLSESLALCYPGNGAEMGIYPGAEVGYSGQGGETQATVLGFGVFSSPHPQDISLNCSATSTTPPTKFEKARLIVARIPSAWAQARPQ